MTEHRFPIFPPHRCDQCGTWASTARVAARDAASEETITLCVQCDDLGRWRTSPYIQDVLARAEASAAAWEARATFAHRLPRIPAEQLVREWLTDIVVWCAAHDLSVSTLWPDILKDAAEDQAHAQETHRDE